MGSNADAAQDVLVVAQLFGRAGRIGSRVA